MELTQYLKQKKKIRKILLLGAGAVGKTSMLKMLKETKYLKEIDDSSQHYKRTLFLDLEALKISEMSEIEKEGTFQMYDIAGQTNLPIHATKDIKEAVLGSVDLVVLMFANDSMQSLLDIEKWIQIIENYKQTTNDGKYSPEFILIKNKADLKGTIDESLIKEILKQEQRIIRYFSISCFDGMGIDELKKWLVSYCFGSDKN